MSGIPAIVPQTLRTEATRVQNQLKVLISNYGILSGRLEKDPENKILINQLGEVQDYIVFYNQEQCFLLDKIRQFLKDLESGKFFNKQISLNSTGVSSTSSSSPGGKPSPASLSDDEFGDKSSSCEEEEEGADQDGTQSPEGEDIYLQYLTDDNLYKGHEDAYEVNCESPLEYETKFCSPTKKFREREEIFNDCKDQTKYMKNLEMLTNSVLNDCETSLQNQRLKNQFRQFLYIPEVSDKKYRNQSFLVKLALSPPQLRKRKEPGNKHKRPIRAVTFPPVRMGTRKQSSMKQQRKDEEKLEIEKLLKTEPVEEEEME